MAAVSVARSTLGRIRGVPIWGALVLVASLAYASQMAFDSGDAGRPLGILLFGLLFPATGLLVYDEARMFSGQAQLNAATQETPASQTSSQPWRTFLGTSSLIMAITGAGLAGDEQNNVWAGLAVLAGVVLLAVACWPDGALHVSGWRATLRRNGREISLALLLLAAGAIARYYQLENLPLMEQDEGQFGINALNLRRGEGFLLFGTMRFDNHPAAFTFVQAASMGVFGETASGLRVPSALLGSLNLLMFYLLTRRMLGRGAAFVATGLLAFSFYHLYFSRIGAFDMIVVQLPLTAMLYFLYRGVHSHQRLDYALGGISLGIGLWLDYNNKSTVFIPWAAGLILYLVLTRRLNGKSDFTRLLLFAVGALVVLLPVWRALAHEGSLWSDPARGRFIFDQPALGNAIERFDTSNPVLIILNQLQYSLFGITHFHDASHLSLGTPMLDSLTSVFFFVGLAYSVWQWWDIRYGIPLICWAIGLQGSVWAITPPQAHRLALIIIPTYLLAAIGLTKLGSLWATTFRWRSAYLAILFAIMLPGIVQANFASLLKLPNNLSWKQTIETGKLIYEWSDHQIYYLGAPWVYADGHGAILFYSGLKSLSVRNVEDVRTVVPLRKPAEKDVVFILNPGHFEDLDYLRSLYPKGILKEWREPGDDTDYLMAYIVARQEANDLAWDAAGQP